MLKRLWCRMFGHKETEAVGGWWIQTEYEYQKGEYRRCGRCGAILPVRYHREVDMERVHD